MRYGLCTTEVCSGGRRIVSHARQCRYHAGMTHSCKVRDAWELWVLPLYWRLVVGGQGTLCPVEWSVTCLALRDMSRVHDPTFYDFPGTS
jgi:hypothetical protein